MVSLLGHNTFESFTGGDGDGEWSIDEDEDEEVVLKKLGSRIDYIRKRKPNLDPQHEVKNAKMYRSWTEGGDDSLYMLLHMRFKDIKTFHRQTHRRSGSMSPDELDSDSNGEETSKSDTNGSGPGSTKARAKKNGGISGIKSGVDSMASAANGFLAAKQASSASKQSASESKNNVALQRLDFERYQAEFTNKITAENMELRRDAMRIHVEAQKRKLMIDEQMAEREQEDAKRRRITEERNAEEQRERQAIETKVAKQQLFLARIKELNALVADPSTDEEVRAIYKAQISAAAVAMASL